MATLADGLDRFKTTVLVAGLAGDIFVDIVKLEPGVHIMFKEQVVSCPTGGAMTFLAF